MRWKVGLEFQSNSPMTPGEAVAVLRLLNLVDQGSIKEVGDTRRVVFTINESTNEERAALLSLGGAMLGDSRLVGMGPETIRG